MFEVKSNLGLCRKNPSPACGTSVAPITPMAKSRKRNAGTSAVASDAGNPQYARATRVAGPDPERIAERAYQKYIERGGSDGRDLDDWLEAERELARTR